MYCKTVYKYTIWRHFNLRIIKQVGSTNSFQNFLRWGLVNTCVDIYCFFIGSYSETITDRHYTYLSIWRSADKLGSFWKSSLIRAASSKVKFWKRPKTPKNDIFGSQNDHFWSFFKVFSLFQNFSFQLAAP